jgi:hypothetical protein
MNLLAAVGLLLLLAGPAQAQQAEQRDMRLVGHDDLQARSAYQPVIHAVDRANTGMHILELAGAARGIANFTGRPN